MAARIGTWYTGFLTGGYDLTPGDSPFQTGSTFGAQTHEGSFTVSSDDWGQNPSVLFFTPLLFSRGTLTTGENFAIYPENIANLSFSTVNASTSNKDGDFTPVQQGDVSKVFVPDGQQFGFDFYVETSVSGTTLQAPEGRMGISLFAVKIADTSQYRHIRMESTGTQSFSLGGSVEQFTLSSTISGTRIIETDEVLVATFFIVVDQVPQPTLSGTVDTTWSLLCNQPQGGIGGDTTDRGSMDMNLYDITYLQNSGDTAETGLETTRVSKDALADSSALGSADRYLEAFRLGDSTGVGSGEEVKTVIKKLIDGFSAKGIGTELFALSKNIQANAKAVGQTVKVVGKLASGFGAGSALGNRTLQALREGTASSSVTGLAGRVVTYVRSAEAQGLGVITERSVRIDVPISALVEGGGGGTTINVRPVYVFDD